MVLHTIIKILKKNKINNLETLYTNLKSCGKIIKY